VSSAWIVVGLGWGDEGKGSVTDALVRKTGARTVVRFNGGGQAAHNVVDSIGRCHTFSQWGAGTLAGARTVLTKDFVLSPLPMKYEAEALAGKGVREPYKLITVDERALVSTPFHAALGQLRELARGVNGHGTCGVGVGETVADSLINQDCLRAGDLRGGLVRDKVRELRKRLMYQAHGLIGRGMLDSANFREALILLESQDVEETCARWLIEVGRRISIWSEEQIAGSVSGMNLVLEGAQGALLDEWHGFHPYTTWSTTTALNARAFLAAAGWKGEQVTIGVVRSYATRHGPGPFPTERPDMKIPEHHNNDNGWQGAFRQGVFDAVATRYAIAANEGVNYVALTHCDRRPELGVCVAYQTQYGRIKNLKVSRDRDLARQQKLGELVASATPIVEGTGSVSEIEEAVGVPIGVESWGNAAENKEWRRRRWGS
jgi:adenylosuccinate synthase